jgi:hypothetical protein
MDRKEALAVLHEILEAFNESVIMNSVSLYNPPISATSKDYPIKINCTLDSASRQCISQVLKKRKLFLNESEGFVIIHGT